ncbi:NAD kinase [uncultured Sanguibacteroides sp.]|uniref:NAD kinase n=1 Tax=uncultured Sanguibacteroides sp. TaxID=1635151 RepID=UPI0025CFE40C|nr:NAD kinase [uncultured Sanguibacteroides sp.]
MKIAIFGRVVETHFFPFLESMLKNLRERGAILSCYHPFYSFLKQQNRGVVEYFDSSFDEVLSKGDVDVLFSVGGDGTFLNSVIYVRDSGIPILGINSGRLGFLANIAQEEISRAVAMLCAGDFEIEQRDLIHLDIEENPFSDFNYALNEVSVLKTERSSLLKVHAYIEGEYLTTYWADGLIVATPTGSTAYSLSGGGPIVSPACDNLILTPVSPHNLSIRPLILPGNVRVKLQVESRSADFMLSLDSRMHKISNIRELFISSGNFKLNVVKMPDHSYYETLRNKLRWGEDLRNEK